ncbi:MAG: DNA replication and repair protein RecF [Armatimonadota bacterium]|nr:DNA replication and repair protein RecF [Armatimonadota bacterium]MCX7776450.1 DNA replication and repair protein RecF [Armatimonadota bacterium]MDW8024248.1 DNA replication and repair protein RecF [Armatimonadota bacterium]
MHICRIMARNFRIYSVIDIALPTGIIAVVGDNAQGKTTFVEAIAFALTGESPRTHDDREVLQKGAKYAVVKVLVRLEKGEEHWLEIAIADGRKRWIIDGKARRKWEEGWAPFHVVYFMPHEIQIVSGEPRGRRELLDKTLSHWNHSYHFNLLNYRRAISHRNALLERINQEGNLTKESRAEIDNWNMQVAKYGARLIGMRLEFIQRWHPLVWEFFSELGGVGRVELRYVSSLGEDALKLYSSGKIEALLERYIELLEEALLRDIETTATSVGPHRDDLQILIDNMDVRDYGSSGQQKLTLLAMKLSLGKLHELERKMSSIILLDDALSQLDNKRRRKLFEVIQRYEQCIITMTSFEDIPQPFRDICALFQIERGKVTRIK